MQIINRANLPIETLTALERELPRFGTLQEFVLCGIIARTPMSYWPRESLAVGGPRRVLCATVNRY